MTKEQKEELEHRAKNWFEGSGAMFFAWKNMVQDARGALTDLLDNAVSENAQHWEPEFTARVAKASAELTLLLAAESEYRL